MKGCKIRGIGCSNTQPFDYLELEVPKMPLVKNTHCPQCGKEMTRIGTFCSRSCASKSARRGQLEWEQNVAKQMEQGGWEIISPTACCDRIGIKDGRVYFLEFKPEGSTTLRSFQKAVRSAVPHMYRVVIGNREGMINTIKGDGRKPNRERHPTQLRKRTTAASSRFIGVSWSKDKSKWRTSLMVKGKRVHLGYFSVEEDAARAYGDELQRRLGGEFCASDADNQGNGLEVESLSRVLSVA